MLKNNRITKSLCAVMLTLCLLLPGTLTTPAEAAPDDVYAINVEFGNLSFYYDYGTWNVNTMRYEAAATSANPANGTTAGFPGWYGFDGTANKISIENGSAPGKSVTMSLHYRSLESGELSSAGTATSVSGVTMTVDGWNNNSVTVASNSTAVGYIHLAGEPVTTDDTYDSATMQPIGMLTLKIDSWT